MKITIIRHSIRNRGGDRVVNSYAAYLVEKGHEVIYWANEIKSDLYLDSRIKINSIPFKGKLGTMLFTALTDFHSDVVLADIIVMGCCAWIRNRRSVLYFAQDYDVSYYSSKILQALLRIICWIAFNIIRIPVLAVSEELLKKLRKLGLCEYYFTPSGIDLDFYKRIEPDQFTSEKKSCFVILLAVYEDHRKGVDIAKKSLSCLASIYPYDDWEVWAIAGELPAIEGVKIKNLGFLSEHDLRAALSSSDIYLVPSRSEGLSILLLNALACQCVVVGTEASNIITNGVNGLVSAVEDWEGLAQNLKLVFDNEKLRQRLREGSRRLAENFSFKDSCEKFEEALNRFLNKK